MRTGQNHLESLDRLLQRHELSRRSCEHLSDLKTQHKTINSHINNEHDTLFMFAHVTCVWLFVTCLEGLAEEALDFSCARNRQFVVLTQLVHTQDRNDVLQGLVILEKIEKNKHYWKDLRCRVST